MLCKMNIICIGEYCLKIRLCQTDADEKILNGCTYFAVFAVVQRMTSQSKISSSPSLKCASLFKQITLFDCCLKHINANKIN